MSDPGSWLPIGRAAAAAGIARRTAFRWVARGLVPIREANGRRVVQVEGLRVAAGRSDSVGAVGTARASPAQQQRSPPADEETIAALEEAAMCAQDLAQALMARVERIELHLGIPKVES